MRLIFFFLLVANLAFFIQSKFFTSGEIAPTAAPAKDALPANGAGLVLLAELPASAKANDASHKRAEAKSGPDTTSSKAELCTMVGPYVQLLHAEYLIENLSALGVKSQIRNIEINDGEVFWVYLPPELSEKEALRRLYELQKKNIESYIISKGDLANGISFGQFADSFEANKRAEALKAQGYSAAIRSMPKTIKETWVVLESGSDEKISDKAWLGLLDSQDNLEKRQNFCSGVASQ